MAGINVKVAQEGEHFAGSAGSRVAWTLPVAVVAHQQFNHAAKLLGLGPVFVVARHFSRRPHKVTIVEVVIVQLF